MGNGKGRRLNIPSEPLVNEAHLIKTLTSMGVGGAFLPNLPCGEHKGLKTALLSEASAQVESEE